MCVRQGSNKMSLVFPQTITLHFKHLSSIRVSKYVTNEDSDNVTVTFQLQSDKTRQYREYTTIVSAASGYANATAIIQKAYEDVWLLQHGDMLSFVGAEAIKPGSNEVFAVPTYA